MPDSLVYQSCHITQALHNEIASVVVDEDAEDLGLAKATPIDSNSEAVKVFHSKLNKIVTAMKGAYPNIDPTPEVVLTVKSGAKACEGMLPNFRYAVMDSVEDEKVKGYKANRAGLPVLDGLVELFDYIATLDYVVLLPEIEADDYCVRMGLEGHIVAALDKDVVYSVPRAYNYGKEEWVSTTSNERRKWFFTQCITGDSSDGLRGVFRVGAKGAEKALKNLESMTDYEAWVVVIKQYLMKDQTVEEAIATARCVSMVQWTIEDGLVLWEPPTKENEWMKW